jgi:ubiquinone biosynthesis protein COQ9
VDSDAFLDARIANVMSFEAWKAGRDPGAPLRRLVEGLGRLRYGSSVSRRA